MSPLAKASTFLQTYDFIVQSQLEFAIGNRQQMSRPNAP
jgi:hypothetical protein